MTDKTYPSIDGYRILRVIGHGGMSTVYLAEQASLDRKVALKVMLADALADEVSRARFENEARTIARLEHPNIVGIYEVGRTGDGLPFYSMPYLSRGHLAQRRLAGDQPKVAAILRSLLDALDYAHVRGVVHRDVKAENVLFDDADRPMLADFGIALRRGSNPRLTSAGLAVGSTAYMPPEQARGQDVDRRADLYSIGVLTWEMLVGQLPYNAGDALTMALKHVQEPVPRLPAALKHWQPLIDKAMAKQPDQRYASADDMLQALDALERRSGRAFTAVEVPAAAREPEAAARRPRWLLAGIGAIAALALAAGYLSMRESTSQPPAGTPSADAAGATGLPVPAEGAVTGLGDPLAAAGGSVAAFVANAEQQLRNGALLSPANANAWDSIEAAWRTNPTDPDTLRLTAELFDALGNAAERALLGGDTAGARAAFHRAQQLDVRRGGTGASIILLRKRLDAALERRLTALLAKPASRASAATLLAETGWLGLDAARQRALQARVGPATRAATGTAKANATAANVEILTVSRADYARFANATGRAAADCGKGFFGRKLKWNNTGSDRKPVACVSAADAQAYASWLSVQDGVRYHLPSAGELRAQPTSAGGWLALCADHACSNRMANGKRQPLDASRGYSDVGILLVRPR
ncbi:bifunctional serine/threonine-protein kinase/formylglycine-generating enzyme family protein [Thermomonas sp.]|uniref:bifunctional serine/threonine-protein kinase/formylglycine-generating enzyme family protein n=1 Tax=Thermomonas sp. TaxID=1971895 RepID=UPI00257D1EAE|nr:bifunctional serine/threonine-protein kinase/formylglycine-generating enzyme family protein [Thermomonas sp.]